MSLKYDKLLNQRPDQPCPCTKAFIARARTAFRLMRNPPKNDKDFVPPPMMPGGNLAPRDPCDRLALSFFDTPDAAQRLFNVMHKRLNENTVKRYGDHIGEIDLVVTDGIMSEPDQKGHINLHQETNAEFAHRVKNLQKVFIPATSGGSSAA